MIISMENRMCHLVLRRERLETVTVCNPEYSGPNIQVEATAKDHLCHMTIGYHLGATNKYLGSETNQCQTSHYPLV